MTMGAVKMEFTPKIGTVVIIDLKIADVPKDIPVVTSMEPVDVSLNVDYLYWTVSNADGANYSGSRKVFFFSLKDGDLLVHEGDRKSVV